MWYQGFVLAAAERSGGKSDPLRIDCHVHMIGTGSGGSGCWYRPRGLTRIGEPVLLRTMGLRTADLRGNFDEIYVEALRQQVAAASLDALVILACARGASPR